MSLSSAKAKLDAQGGDPVTGYISKTDHQESYDELVDDTALTGATTAEAITVSGAAVVGTVNGRDPDDLAKGPASATDNALVRFDGTDGKTVQNSGITVDDSGNVSSNLTVSKASAILNVSASSGYPELKLTRTVGNYGLIGFYTGATPRFQMGLDNSSESGSNAGSDFYIYAQDDAGSTIGAAGYRVRITRSTGKVTLGSVGATAGLELGASGPRVMSGTGSPQSVVTAPVGSTYIDTAATTGAIRWIKATGTGNTGWVVADGDTGWRNVSASLNATFLTANPNATMFLRRVGDTVRLSYKAGASPTFTTNYAQVYAIPSGFRPGSAYETPLMMLTSATAPGAAFKAAYFDANVLNSGNTWASGTQYWGDATYTTTDAWPSSLPGSAA